MTLESSVEKENVENFMSNILNTRNFLISGRENELSHHKGHLVVLCGNTANGIKWVNASCGTGGGHKCHPLDINHCISELTKAGSLILEICY